MQAGLSSVTHGHIPFIWCLFTKHYMSYTFVCINIEDIFELEVFVNCTSFWPIPIIGDVKFCVHVGKFNRKH